MPINLPKRVNWPNNFTQICTHIYRSGKTFNRRKFTVLKPCANKPMQPLIKPTSNVIFAIILRKNRAVFICKYSRELLLFRGGLVAPTSDQIKRVRKSFAHEQQWDAFLLQPEMQKRFGDLAGATLKNIPAGFDPDHPRAQWIKHKQWFLKHTYSDQETASPQFTQQLVEDYNRLRPFLYFLSSELQVDHNGEANLLK